MWWNTNKRITGEPKKLIAATQNKWRKLASSTEPINRLKASNAVKTAYEIIDKKEPEIIFFDSPYRALKTVLENLVKQLNSQQISYIENLLSHSQTYNLESELLRHLVSYLAMCLQKQLEQQLGKQLHNQLDSQLKTSLHIQLSNQIDSQWKKSLNNQLKNRLDNQNLKQLVNQQKNRLSSQLLIRLIKQLENRIYSELTRQKLLKIVNLLEAQQWNKFVIRLGNLLFKPLFYNNCIQPESWAIDASYLDSYIYIFNSTFEQNKWLLFQSLVTNCGWIFPYENTCIVCEHPIKLSLDRELLPHADGEFALLFADGYSLYFNHGVAIPRKYGQLHSSRWEVQWILEEDNPEIRRGLIQEIGYERICKELPAKELDAWREYTLLSLEDIIDDIDKQPIYLLKMSCPSTGFIHALRVPPDIQSARDAIRWVNWGIDPDMFVMET